MNATGPVLRDIHLPQISWWPPAIGWWLLAALLLIFITAGVFVARRYHRHAQPRRAVRRELDALASRFAQDHNAVALVAGLSKLLRRIALLLEPAAAARDASEWRRFLEQHAPGAFDDAQLIALADAPYRPRATFDADALLTSTRHWCARALRKRVRQPA